MFHEKVKKQFPEGTFLPLRQRVLSIIQLCLGFTALLYVLSTPFMGEHFTLKSKGLIYDYVINNSYFEDLPLAKKEQVLNDYSSLKKAASLSFIENLRNSFDLLFFKIPIYERIWILFALIIPILLLKKVEGAKEAAWIFPLIALAFLINNHNSYPTPSHKKQLFPKEEVLIDRYLKKSISNLTIGEQQKELTKAWQFYLVEEYAKEDRSEDPIIFKAQVAKGEFAFNLSRLGNSKKASGHQKQPLFLLIVYLVWNLFFAIGASKHRCKTRPLLKNPQAPAN